MTEATRRDDADPTAVRHYVTAVVAQQLRDQRWVRQRIAATIWWQRVTSPEAIARYLYTGLGACIVIALAHQTLAHATAWYWTPKCQAAIGEVRDTANVAVARVRLVGRLAAMAYAVCKQRVEPLMPIV
jgi:hypothetical protein